MKKYLVFIFTLLLWISCSKEIEIDYADIEPQLVVDGSIETGQPAFVFLSKSQSFNESVSPEQLSQLFVNGADVRVTEGDNEYILSEICTDQLTQEQLEAISQATGISIADLNNIDYCIYGDFTLIGETGKTYELDIDVDGEHYHSTTSILEPIPLDSIWFQANATDTLGYIYALLTDPEETGNSYRWFAQRISKRPNGSLEDPTFISPIGGTFDDTFFNGLQFQFFAPRGYELNSNLPEDNNEEQGSFKVGDTVVVKMCTITPESHDFYFLMDDQTANIGSPFATTVNVPRNIENGLGIWTGYSPFIDTLVIQ